MAGAPTRKFATDDPRRRGAALDARVKTEAAAASGASPPEQRSRDERRGVDRLIAKPSGRLQQAFEEPVNDQSYLLPREAGGMALVLLAAFAIAAVVHRGLPSTGTLFYALGSVGLFAASGLLAFILRNAVDRLRAVLVVVVIVPPMACAGVALAMWAGERLPAMAMGDRYIGVHSRRCGSAVRRADRLAVLRQDCGLGRLCDIGSCLGHLCGDRCRSGKLVADCSA
ncbi:MAG: hypothetical protein ACKO1N_04715 [Erythrobacter sp.]